MNHYRLPVSGFVKDWFGVCNTDCCQSGVFSQEWQIAELLYTPVFPRNISQKESVLLKVGMSSELHGTVASFVIFVTFGNYQPFLKKGFDNRNDTAMQLLQCNSGKR